MRAWGAPQADIDQLAAQIEARASSPELQCFEVHADNLRTVAAFHALRTQWQRSGMGGTRTGLLYDGVFAWLREYVSRPRARREMFTGLQIMETAVLAYDAERREEEEE